mgnify:CR=1 FL=1
MPVTLKELEKKVEKLEEENDKLKDKLKKEKEKAKRKREQEKEKAKKKREQEKKKTKKRTGNEPSNKFEVEFNNGVKKYYMSISNKEGDKLQRVLRKLTQMKKIRSFKRLNFDRVKPNDLLKEE